MEAAFAGERCLVIGEVAQAHEGSLGTALAYVDAVAHAGADAVKFQTHIAAAESTPGETWRVPFSPQDASRYDYWHRMEFTEEQWRLLRERAEKRGLLFLSSPFSVEAVELLKRVGVAAWKVGSGQVSDTPMMERVAASGLPVLLSTGMSPVDEVDRAVARLRHAGVHFAVLQATSVYPTPPERVGLNLLQTYRERYACPVGLSDHSGTIFPGIAAAALGACVVEVHVTFSRRAFGPDVPASVTLEELATLAEGIRFMERMRASPVDKDALAAELEPLRKVFTKSVVARIDLPAATLLEQGHLAAKKPGTGIPAERIGQLVGRRLRRAVAADAMISWEDLE